MPDAVRVVIAGRVQGVGYRAWTVEKAACMNLKGWVRNRSDGTVEAVFSGEEATVAAMLIACRDGPMAARVDSIESYSWKSELNESGFSARPSV